MGGGGAGKGGKKMKLGQGGWRAGMWKRDLEEDDGWTTNTKTTPNRRGEQGGGMGLGVAGGGGVTHPTTPSLQPPQYQE